MKDETCDVKDGTPRYGDQVMTALMGGRAMTRVVGGVGGVGGDGGMVCRYYDFWQYGTCVWHMSFEARAFATAIF